MKIIAACLLTVMLACAYNLLFAQTNSSAIQGKILADSTIPADRATVVLLKSRDSSIVQSTISDKTGVFNFSRLQAGSYLVFITKLNYGKSYSGPYQVNQGNNLDIGTISIKQAANQLSEVSITGKKDFVEVRADKTVLNVDQNIMASGASLYDVLSSSPGVKVINDDILYRGGQKALIAIDGKPILLTGEELTSFLKNYQSSSISKIELIDNPGGKYDASAGGGMINIVLKRNKEMGYNTSLVESAAVGDKYKFNTGINYTLRTSKLNLYASYNYSNNSIPHTIKTDRLINTGTELDDFNLNYYANIKSRNNSFSLGADYQLSSRQTIGFLINGYDNNSTLYKTNTTAIATNGQLDSSIYTHSTVNRDMYDLNYNLNYKINLDKDGKSVLSADGNYSDYHRSSNESLENDFFNAAGQTASDPLFYTDGSPSHITISSKNIDFSRVLSKNTSIGAGLKNNQVNSNNMINFDQKVNGKYKPDSSLTDHFIYHERINAAYIDFKTKFDKTSLYLTLRGEQTNSSAQSITNNKPVDSSYFNLFPTVQLSQELSKNNQLTFLYSRNITRPNYQDLNPFIGYVDQYYYSTGNPYLKPEYINTYRLSDFILNKYKVALEMIQTDDFFATVYQQNNVTKVYTTIKDNIGTRYQYRAVFNVPVDITNWWNVNADLIAFLEKYTYTSDNGAKVSTNGIQLTLNQTFKLTPKLSVQANGYYESPTYFVISQYKPLYIADAGLSYSILKNKGSIKLTASDIFNSNTNRYHTNYTNLDLTAQDRLGTRFIGLTFNYRFGNSSVKPTHTGTNPEQRRLGSSNNEN